MSAPQPTGFARILAGGGFDEANPERGRFRSYLLGPLKHFLADQRKHEQRLKRGGGVTPESLDAAGAMSDDSSGLEVAGPVAAPRDADFDREWALTVMDRALTSLQKEFTTCGKADHFEALKPWLMGEGGPVSQAGAAEKLGLTEGAVKVSIHRLRQRFRDVVRTEIAQTLRDPALVDEEPGHLVEALSQPTPGRRPACPAPKAPTASSRVRDLGRRDACPTLRLICIAPRGGFV